MHKITNKFLSEDAIEFFDARAELILENWKLYRKRNSDIPKAPSDTSNRELLFGLQTSVHHGLKFHSQNENILKLQKSETLLTTLKDVKTFSIFDRNTKWNMNTWCLDVNTVTVLTVFPRQFSYAPSFNFKFINFSLSNFFNFNFDRVYSVSVLLKFSGSVMVKIISWSKMTQNGILYVNGLGKEVLKFSRTEIGAV